MSIRRRLVGSAAWSVAGRVATVAAGLVINMLLTRLLVPEEFGAYVLVLTIAGIAALVGQFGANQAALRIVSGLLSLGKRSMARSVVIHSFAIASLGLTVTSIVLLCLGGWIGSEVFDSRQIGESAGWMAMITIVLGWQAMLSDTYRAYQNIRSAVVFGGVLSALFFLVSMIVAFFGHTGLNLSEVLMWFVVAYVAALVIGTGNLITRTDHSDGKESSKTRDLLKIAIPLALPNVITILFQLDTWILGAYRPEAEVAVYSIAAKVAFIISAPLMIINFAIAPFITELHAQNDMKKLERFLRASATIATMPAVMLFVVFAIWHKELLEGLFGEFYGAGGASLIVLGLAQLVTSWTGSCGNVLLMVGKKRLLVSISAISGVALLGVSVALAADYGALGVATGYFVGTAVLNIGAWIMVRKSIGVYSHSYAIPGRVFAADLRRIFS